MSPKSRATPSRPPVRSKTALPAPRVAPKRIRIPWHQRRPVQVVLAVIVVGLLVLLVTQGLSTWHHHQATMKAKKGVKAFDAAYQTELTPLSNAATYSLLVLETIMLVFFGLSWFVKGRKILSGG